MKFCHCFHRTYSGYVYAGHKAAIHCGEKQNSFNNKSLLNQCGFRRCLLADRNKNGPPNCASLDDRL